MLLLIFLLCSLFMALHKSWLVLPFLAIVALLCWDLLRNSSVWSAFAAFRDGNIVRVRHLLAQVRWPKRLSPTSQTYYHWLRGIVEMADGRFTAAEVELLMAASGTLLTENDRALVHCLLSEVNIQHGRRRQAEENLYLARKLDHHQQVRNMIEGLQGRINAMG